MARQGVCRSAGSSFAVSSWWLRFPSLRSCCAVRVLSRFTLFACWTLVMRKGETAFSGG